MEELNENGSALQESTTTKKSLEDLKKAIADANAELELLAEEISKQKKEKADLAQEILDAEDALKVLNEEFETKANELALSFNKGATSETKEAEEISVEFVVPAFRHEGVEYKSKDVEAAAAEDEEWALELIQYLVKIKSGVVTVKKGGE